MAKAKEEVKKEKVDLTNVKEELKEYIDLQIKKGFTEELEKSNKRLVREKTKKIIVKDIVIVILLAIICFLLFLLYDAKFFDKFFTNDNNNPVEEVVNTNEEEKEAEKVITLDELKKTYSYLLDNIYINENSKYVTDYYGGKLTNEIKNYIALNNMNADNIQAEGDYNIIDEELLKEEALRLFNDFENINFDFNDNKIRYLNRINSYISDSVIDKIGTNIEREITDIKENGNIVITTVEGLIVDNKLYNILDGSEIENYSKPLSDYKGLLNTIKYTFKDGKLIKIEKGE